jgi:glycosyl transferase, family 25
MVSIFVISLRSAENRRAHIEKQFKQLNLDFEWFDAIDGKKLNEEDINKYCDIQAIRNAPNWLSRGAIGCALSHFFVYQEIIKRNLPFALIFEDDVLLQNDFKDVVLSTLSHLNDNQIISLYYQSWQPLKLSKSNYIPLTKGFGLFEPVDICQPINAVAYIITNSACRSMVKAILPVRFAADCWGNFYENGGFIKFSCLYPSIVDIIDAKSSIDYVTNKRMSKILDFIDKRRVFPLYQLLRLRRKNNRMKVRKVELTNDISFVERNKSIGHFLF